MPHPPTYTARRAEALEKAHARAHLTPNTPHADRYATASAWCWTRKDPAKGSPTLIAETRGDDPYDALRALLAKMLTPENRRGIVDALTIVCGGTATPTLPNGTPDHKAARVRVVLASIHDRDGDEVVSVLRLDDQPEPMIDDSATGKLNDALRATLAALPRRKSQR